VEQAVVAAVRPAVAASGAVERLRERLGLLVLVSSSSFTLLLVSVMSPVLSTVAGHFGAGTGAALKAQSIITMSGIGMMFGGVLAGWLGDRIGARRSLLAMLVLYGLAGSAGLFIDDIALLLASRVVLGGAASGIAAATYVIIGARYDGAQRARMLGYQIAVLSVVGIATLLLAGELATRGGWQAPFLIYLSAFAMLVLALAARLPGGPSRTGGPAGPDGGLRSVIRLWPLYLMIVPLYVVFHMFILHLSLALAGDGIASPVVQSRIMTAMLAMTFVGGLAYGRILERLGAGWTFVLILAALAASTTLFGMTRGIPAAVAACALSGLAGATIPPFLIGRVLAGAPPAAQGRALGLMYTAMYVGDFVNPLIVTPLRAAIGNHEAFTLVGLVTAGAAVVAALRQARRPRLSAS
jgi:MFS family permease